MKKIKLFGATVFVLACSMGTAGADQYSDGIKAAQKGDFAIAAQKWQPLASHGDANAQFNIALLYHSGAAGNINEGRAVQWYHKAAENGHPVAQEFLAAAYAEGWFGLKKDAQRAQYWESKIQLSQ